MKFDKEKIHIIADWLDEINYRMVCTCILRHTQISDNICFPDFSKINLMIRQENPMYGFIFAFFRLGQNAESAYLHKFIPEKIFKALIDVKLVIKTESGTFKMDNLAILPIGDIYLLSGLPIRYPTADIDTTYVSHFSDEHQQFLCMMPRHVRGDKALELYGTHGAFGLQCAKNGLEVTIYPLDECYQSMLQCNISLNHLEDRVQLCDILNIKNQNIKFDFICSCLPSFSDVMNENRQLCLSNDSLMKFYLNTFENLLINLLLPSGIFLFLLKSVGSQYDIFFNEKVLKPWHRANNMDLSINVLYKEFLPFKLGLLIESTRRPWEKEFGLTTDHIKNKIEAFVQSDSFSKEDPIYIYTELIQGNQDHSDSSDFTLYPIYNPEKTDYLYLQSQMLNF
jgi:hypothetical protein